MVHPHLSKTKINLKGDPDYLKAVSILTKYMAKLAIFVIIMKRGKAEIESSILTIQDWILDGVSTGEMIRTIIENEWCKSDRQANKLIARARDRFVAENSAPIQEKRAIKVQELIALKDSLKTQYKGTPAGMMAIARVENLIIKLEGLSAPTKVEVTGKDGKPIEHQHQHLHHHTYTIDWGNVPTEALQALLSARKKITQIAQA